ncbi:MAG: hypothetical protein NTV63_00630 [Candidatus Woesearchaeota archaeon]|nr:hypothetical protein [Candidatus Woesearchaeota archaeon]
MSGKKSSEICISDYIDEYFANLACKDYKSILSEVELITNEEVKMLLLMQTVEGHSRKGHGKFRDRKGGVHTYMNSSMEDVVDALEESERFEVSKKDVKNSRQKLIDDIKKWTMNAIKGKEGEFSHYLVNENNEPLMGIEMFRDMPIKNRNDVLKGIYLGSRMDSIEWRNKTVETYRGTPYEVTMGGGKCVAIDREKMDNTRIEDICGMEKAIEFLNNYGDYLTLEFLSTEEFENNFDELERRGIILTDDAESSGNIRNGYVRHRKGNGVSDDMAVIMAGLKYGFDAALGLYLIDAVDTLDKYAPIILKSGQDERLGDIIKEKMPDIMADHEITSFIRLAINEDKKNLADSSQRRFLQIDPDNKLSAIESHFLYIQKGIYSGNMNFGFARTPSEKFYAAVDKRKELLDQV